GRALDLGCGTGTNVRYLAEHGWEATGVDAVPAAIDRATAKLGGVPKARVLLGDVTDLERLGLAGPFDLVLDIGCFHSIERRRRRAPRTTPAPTTPARRAPRGADRPAVAGRSARSPRSRPVAGTACRRRRARPSGGARRGRAPRPAARRRRDPDAPTGSRAR